MVLLWKEPFYIMHSRTASVHCKASKDQCGGDGPAGKMGPWQHVRHLQPVRRSTTQPIWNVDGSVKQQEGSDGAVVAGRQLNLRRAEGAAARCESINYTQSQAVPACRQDALKVIRGAHTHANMHASAHSETHSRLSVRALRIFALQTVKLTLNSGHNKVPRN